MKNLNKNYSPEITSFELGKLYYSLFCPHFRIQTVAGKLRAGPSRRSWDSRAMMIFKWWREKDKMWSRVGGVAISKFDRYHFWTVTEPPMILVQWFLRQSWFLFLSMKKWSFYRVFVIFSVISYYCCIFNVIFIARFQDNSSVKRNSK